MFFVYCNKLYHSVKKSGGAASAYATPPPKRLPLSSPPYFKAVGSASLSVGRVSALWTPKSLLDSGMIRESPAGKTRKKPHGPDWEKGRRGLPRTQSP